MATKNSYKSPHRRRAEGKTDYKKRLGLIRSEKVRLVIRKSLDNIVVQFVAYKKEGDVIKACATSEMLKKLGWKASGGNIPAAYLTGLAAGILAKKAGVKEAVLDLGLQRSTKGSRLYAALKGALDAGVSVPHDAKILPDEKRISGQHIASYIESLKDLPNQFAAAKAAIMKV